MEDRKALETLIGRTARRLAVRGAVGGAAWVSAATGAVLLVLFAVDRSLVLPTAARAVAAAALVIAAVSLLYARSLVFVLRRPDARDAAKALEATHPELGGLALSAAEVALGERTRSSVPSREFAELTIDMAASRALSASEAKAAPLRPAFMAVAAALIIAASWYGAHLANPKDTSVFFTRMFDPLAGALYDGQTRIIAIEYPATLAKGESFVAMASVAGTVPDTAVFHMAEPDGTAREVRVAAQGNRFEASLSHVERSFEFHVTAGDATSGKRTVQVVDRPEVASIIARVAPPSYTGLPEARVTGGNVRALRGSAVRAEAAFSKPVDSAELLFADGTRIKPRIDADGTSARFEFPISTSQTYQIALVDRAGFSDSGGAQFSVTADADAPPGVEILRPTRDMTIVPEARLPIQYRASDDFGVSALELVCAVKRGDATEEVSRPIDVGAAGKTAAGSIECEIGRLALAAGDEVTFRLRVRDNLPGGAQVAKSRSFSVRVVTVAEKLEELERISSRAQAAIRSAARSEEASIAALGASEPGGVAR